MVRLQQTDSPKQRAFKTTGGRALLATNPDVSSFRDTPAAKAKSTASKKTNNNNNKRKQKGPAKRAESPSIGDLIRMRRNQNAMKHSIPKASFQRVIRAIMLDLGFDGYRVSRSALEALHELAEERMLNDFEQLNILAQHGGRVTVKPIDYETLRRLGAINRIH
uniref:Histone domain-containing protein n=1 Tax=Panagrellus redivivus TaxID=6233 RepID=A0A7E4VHM5_PANRE